MRITFLAIGSRGDVQPYVALGVGLQKRGHEVTIATYDCFEKLVSDFGLRHFCLTGNPQKMSMTDMVDSGRNPILSNMRMLREFELLSPLLSSECFMACGGADVILYTPLVMGAADIGDSLGIPAFPTSVVPFTPTRDFQFPLFPELPAGIPLRRLYNWLSYYAGHQVFAYCLRQQIIKNGLQPVPGFWAPLLQIGGGRDWTLYGFSPSVIPVPSDWGDWVQVTGFWFLDVPSSWEPSAALQEFLASGPPPVYFGFGSMVGKKSAEATDVVLKALKLTGQRGILATGWGGLAGDVDVDVPTNAFVVDSVPHSWLFPHMAAVVHHGGGGTTAAALQSGVPSIIVPFVVDQYFWGARVARLGVGTKPIPRRHLTPHILARRIDEAVSSKAMRDRARLLAEQIRREEGVQRAVEALERRMEQ